MDGTCYDGNENVITFWFIVLTVWMCAVELGNF